MYKTGEKRRSITVGFFSVFLLFIFQTFVSKLAEYVSPKIDYAFIAPDNAFLYITVHHLIQMMIALTLMRGASKRFGIPFYLKPMFDINGVRYTILFASCMVLAL